MTAICNGLDQLQLRLKTKFANTDFDSKQLVQARTHQLVQLSPVPQNPTLSGSACSVGQASRSQIALVYDAKVAEGQATLGSSSDAGYEPNCGVVMLLSKKEESVI